MSIVVDYTARIVPAALHAADVSGVCRYLSPLIEDTAWKRITLGEYRELVGAGIDVTLNWEYDARDWLGGTARGGSHGSQAAAQARTLGYPAGKVIVGSADFDMSRTEWASAGEDYAAAFAAAVRAGGYRPGVYGPWDVLTWVRDAQLMDAFWQAGMSTAWSQGRNARAWPGAHLRQRGHKTVGGQDTDWNEILIPNWGVVDDMGVEVFKDVPGDATSSRLSQGTAGYAGHQRDTAIAATWQATVETNAKTGQVLAEVAALRVVVEQLAAAITAGGGTVDTAAILAGVDARLTAVRDQIDAELRDAVADLGEGGAAQVRADA